MDKNLSYRTFDQLMASVETDLHNFADEGMINRGSCIKIVQKVNEDLGLKINGNKQTVIKIDNYVGELPSDLLKVNYAFICGAPVYARDIGEIYGNRVQYYTDEEVPLEVRAKGNACINSCGELTWVTQRWKENIVRYTTLSPIRITEASAKMCDKRCPGIGNNALEYEMDLCTGQIKTTLKEGNLYINYLSSMEDESGNLMIIDHPLIRPYYEYAVKKHLMETFFLNGDANVLQRLQFLQMELEKPGGARERAISFIQIIEPSELNQVMEINRDHFYRKYVVPFTADFYKYY